MNLTPWRKIVIDYEMVKAMQDISAVPVEPERSLLDKAATAAERILTDASDRETILEARIAELTEELRQVRAIKAAFEPVPQRLVEGAAA